MKAAGSSIAHLSAWAATAAASHAAIYVKTARVGGHVVMVGNDGRPQVRRRSEQRIGQVLLADAVSRKPGPAMGPSHRDRLPQAPWLVTHGAGVDPSCGGSKTLPWLTRQLASSHAVNAAVDCMLVISAQASQDLADDA